MDPSDDGKNIDANAGFERDMIDASEEYFYYKSETDTDASAADVEGYLDQSEDTDREEGEVLVTRVIISIYFCKICKGQFHDWELYCKHLLDNHELPKECLPRIVDITPEKSKWGSVDDLESYLGHKIRGRQETEDEESPDTKEAESEWEDLGYSDYEYSDYDDLEKVSKNRRKRFGLTHDPEYIVDDDSSSNQVSSDSEYARKATGRKQTRSNTSAIRKKTATYQMTHKNTSPSTELKQQKITEKENGNSGKKEVTQPIRNNRRSYFSKNVQGCFMCGNKFAKKEALDSHLIQFHLKKSLFSCSDCDKPLLNEAALEHHLKHVPQRSQSKISVSHREQILSQDVGCGMCDKKFKHRGCLLFHVKTHVIKEKEKTQTIKEKASSVKKFRCCLCPPESAERYVIISALETHMQSHFTIECVRCLEYFIDTDHLIRHTRICSHPLRLYTCPACNRKFCHVGALIQHLKTYHEDCGVVCTGCGKVFPNESKLSKHHAEKSCRMIVKCYICHRLLASITNKNNSITSLETHLKNHPFPGEAGWGPDDKDEATHHVRIKSEVMKDVTKTVPTVATNPNATCTVGAKIPTYASNFSIESIKNIQTMHYSQGYIIPNVKSNKSAPEKSATYKVATTAVTGFIRTGSSDIIKHGLTERDAEQHLPLKSADVIGSNLPWVGPTSTSPFQYITQKAHAAGPTIGKEPVVKFVEYNNSQIMASLDADKMRRQQRKVIIPSAQQYKGQPTPKVNVPCVQKSLEPKVKFVPLNVESALPNASRGKRANSEKHYSCGYSHPCHRCDKVYKASEDLQIHLKSEHYIRCPDVDFALGMGTMNAPPPRATSSSTKGQPPLRQSSVQIYEHHDATTSWNPTEKHVRLMDQFQRAKLDVSSGNTFRCVTCFIKFPTLEDLHIHLNLRHRQNKCMICDKYFENFGSLSAHNMEYHPKEVEKNVK